jgi:ATP-binding cassette subfamily B multidrug efflux pump
MLKIMKYLRPYALLVTAAIVLLFTQAMSELALPDYMSDIVNEGIQQGGITSAVPEAVRQDRMELLTLFMDGKEKETVLNSYFLIDGSNPEYDRYVKVYPVLSEEPVYVLRSKEKAAEKELNPVMGRAFLSVAYVERLEKEAESGDIKLDGMTIPAGTDLFAAFGRLPVEQRVRIVDEANRHFTALGENMVIQAAGLVKSEYEALGMDTGKIQIRHIARTGVIMLLISILAAACTVMVGFLAAKTSAGLAKDLRRKVFEKVTGFSSMEFDKFSTASLITRTTNDITHVQMAIVFMIRMIFFAPIMGIGGAIRALGKSMSMSWIIALALLLLLGLIMIIFSIAMPKFKLMQKLVDKLNLVTRENLTGMMVIRAFNSQKFEEDRFDKANRDLADTTLFVNRVMSLMFPAMTLIMNGFSLLIVWVGAHRIANSAMQVGDMMAFIQYAMQIISSFLMMSMMFIIVPRASISAQRITEVLDTGHSIKDPDEPLHFDGDITGIVEFRDVTFKFPGAEEPVLKNISFRAEPGKTTAFIGPTGSGKTTLVNLIPRFYDVTGGQILINGIDIRSVPQHELRERIGYVPQKGSLFSGTIESNLKFADENVSDDDMKKYVEIAQAMDFIDEREEGFKAPVSQGGINLSGGQKQRLSIARALVKDPEIFIFDDSFSALDFRTDAALRRALKDQVNGKTVLIVTQRISTIMNADQIIVLDEGRIAGMGTHSELMKTCETYRDIASSQLSGEELA